MTETFGTGDFRYEAVPDWGRLPEGWTLSDVAAVSVDARDNVYVFHRGEHPMSSSTRPATSSTPGATDCSCTRTAPSWRRTRRSSAPTTATTRSGSAP